MSYTIAYSPKEKKKYPLLADKRKKKYTTIAILCILTAFIIICFSPWCDNLRQSIQTDSMRVAEEAAAVFSDQLSAGESVYNALHSYCQYILKNANE